MVRIGEEWKLSRDGPLLGCFIDYKVNAYIRFGLARLESGGALACYYHQRVDQILSKLNKLVDIVFAICAYHVMFALVVACMRC